MSLHGSSQSPKRANAINLVPGDKNGQERDVGNPSVAQAAQGSSSSGVGVGNVPVSPVILRGDLDGLCSSTAAAAAATSAEEVLEGEGEGAWGGGEAAEARLWPLSSSVASSTEMGGGGGV